jgi:1,4-dihydroxy-2-naphthoyl-CoA hydrolase
MLERLKVGSRDDWRTRGQGTLVEHIGVEILDIDGDVVRSRLEIRPELMAPIGYLHAATVIALADTTAGYGAWANLPEAASGFTTLELKSNFLGTARSGCVACEARLIHSGRSTQVWDAVVTVEETGKKIALFRCTQMILYPGEKRAPDPPR